MTDTKQEVQESVAQRLENQVDDFDIADKRKSTVQAIVALASEHLPAETLNLIEIQYRLFESFNE